MLLTVVGVVILFVQADDEFNALALFGDIFVAAGLTPLILYGWSLMLGAGPKGQRKADAIRVAISAFWFVFGLGLAFGGSDERESFGAEILGVVGEGCVEIAVLFIVTKLVWFQEDSEEMLKRLEDEVEILRSSASRGLAYSYFFNFVQPLTSHMRVDALDGTPIDVEIDRGKFEDGHLDDSTLYILVPRNLFTGSDIKGALRDACKDGVFKQGKPKPREGAPPNHRPMFAYLVTTEVGETHMVDIPTVISSIKDRHDLNERLRAEAVANGEKRHVPHVDVGHEIVVFVNTLFDLIETDERAKKCVRIVMIPAQPFNIDVLKHLNLDELERSAPNAIAMVPNSTA